MIFTKKEEVFIDEHLHLDTKTIVDFLRDGEALRTTDLNEEEVENLYSYYLSKIAREND